MEYIRISKGLNNYKLYPRDASFDVKAIVENAQDKDYYYGIFTYEDRHYDHWLKNKSLSGITDVKTNLLVWDFDSEENVELARLDAKEAFSRLIGAGLNLDDIQIYYSGNRGFHLVVKLAEYLTRQEFENVVFGLGNNLKTLDPTVKDQQRLLRMPFTKNPKTGFYCTPLSLEEFNGLTLEQIKDKSKELLTEDWERYESWQSREVPLTKNLKDLKVIKTKTDIPKPKSDLSFTDTLDMSRKPNWLSPARFALQEGFFREGWRNEAFMILASTYRRNGFPKEIAWRMLKGVAELQSKRTGNDEYGEDNLWHQIINPVYGPNWRGGTYSDKENDLLRMISEELNINLDESDEKLSTIEDVEKEFLIYCKGYKEKLVKTGIQIIDQNVMIQTGMMVGILGAPGAGKSSFAAGYVENVSKEGKKALFETLDMSKKQMYVRMLQKECGYSVRYIMDCIDRGLIDQGLDKAIKAVKENYRNVKFNDQTGATIESIEADIANHKQLFGNEFTLVVVDYLEKVRGPFSDPTSNSAFIASRLSDLAKKYDVAILLLLQPKKVAGDPREELISYSDIKGSSVIQQDSRIIMTMWRPGFNPKDNNANDKYASIAVVKANLGEQVRMDFAWDGVSGRIRDMTFDEEQDFKKLLQKNEREKKYQYDKQKGSWEN